MAVEGTVDTPQKQPARPQILKSELQNKVCQEDQEPHHHKLQKCVRTEKQT